MTLSDMHQAGITAATNGRFRVSPMTKQPADMTITQWLDMIKAFNAGFDSVTAADNNPQLTAQFSLRKPQQAVQAVI